MLLCVSSFLQFSLGLQGSKSISSFGEIIYPPQIVGEFLYQNMFDDPEDIYRFLNVDKVYFADNENYEVVLDPSKHHSAPYSLKVTVLNPNPDDYTHTCKANTRLDVRDSKFKDYWLYTWHYIPPEWSRDQHGTAEVMKAHKNTFASADGIPMHAWRLNICTSKQLRISKQNFKRYSGDTDGWEDFNTGIYVPLGKWFRLGMHVRKNDVGKLNGLIEFYLGNDKIFGMNNVETYDPDASHQWCTVNAIYINNQDVPLTCWFDDVVVSENWIPI